MENEKKEVRDSVRFYPVNLEITAMTRPEEFGDARLITRFLTKKEFAILATILKNVDLLYSDLHAFVCAHHLEYTLFEEFEYLLRYGDKELQKN